MKTALFLSLAFSSLLASSPTLRAAERQAMVIGNKHYVKSGTFGDLDTTLNDAATMRRLLTQAGFKLAPEAQDLTRIAMMDALIAFRDGLNPGDEAVVYFAGHGLEYQKNVYLMGTNAEGRLKAQLEAEGISEATISATLAEKEVKLAILLLDCCREIPDASWLSADPSTRSRRGGGAPSVTPPPNVIVGYATSGGRLTNDALSSGDRNGPLVAALSKHWNSGEVFELMWKDVASDVFTASKAAVTAGTAGEIQMPSIYGQTVHRFSFMQGRTTPVQVAKMVPSQGGTGVPPVSVPNTTGGTPALPSAATKEAPFVNSLGMRFVPVPGTKVLFSIWETRRKDYAAYASSVSGLNDEWKAQEIDGVPISQKDDEPVVSVSWEDAVAYCKWLTEKERGAGRIGARDEYRLPTDTEWSYAVGIGDKEATGGTPESKDGKIADVYPWGNGFPPPSGAGNYADASAKAKDTGFGYIDGYATTSPVGSFNANSIGIYDLGGNVWEWCADWYNTEQRFRVLRGGSWCLDISGYLLSSSRFFVTPGGRSDFTGFRCVLVPGSSVPKPDSRSPSPAEHMQKQADEIGRMLERARTQLDRR